MGLRNRLLHWMGGDERGGFGILIHDFLEGDFWLGFRVGLNYFVNLEFLL